MGQFKSQTFNIECMVSIHFRVNYLLSSEENLPIRWISRFFLIYLAAQNPKIDADLTGL